jgi:hypothetical protein
LLGIVALSAGGCAHLIADPMRGDPVFEPAWNGPEEVGAFVPADRRQSPEATGARTPTTTAKRQRTAGKTTAGKTTAPQRQRASKPASSERSRTASSKPSRPAKQATPARRPARAAARKAPPAKGRAASDGLAPMDDLDRGARRVAAAVERIGDEVGRDTRLVGEVFAALGEHRSLEGHTALPEQLHKRLHKANRFVPRERVAPGDVVFFRNTADINGSGTPDDGVTMVGIVERVEDDRVVFISQRAGRVRRMALDPGRPGLVRDDRGQVVNTKLVRWPGIREPLTAGQCFAGFARP